MSNLRQIAPGSVPLDMLRRYLTATGWRPRKLPTTGPADIKSPAARAILEGRTRGRPNFDIFISDSLDHEGVELIVPASIGSSEYDSQVSRTVEALSILEERPESDLVDSIRQIGFDVFRTRIPDNRVIDDTVHLEVATSFVTGIRSLLASTATVEIHPAPYFSRLRKEATEYADNCRFGHTFRGSFGFTVESPIGPSHQESLPGIPAAPPFERRVLRRLVRGLRHLKDAVYKDSIDPIVNSTESGLNANVCEQLEKLVTETSYDGLLFDFRFSPEIRDDVEPTPQVETFEINQPEIEALSASAKVLRGRSSSTNETVFGRVIRLASDSNPSDMTDLMGEREVAILWSSNDFGDITVRSSLSPPDYLIAVEAHATGRPIEVSGILERRPRRWVLLNPGKVVIST